MSDDCAPARGIEGLVFELAGRLASGEGFDNRKLERAAQAFLNGSRASGDFTSRDAYDAMEAAAAKYLMERRAEGLMRGPVASGLAFLREFYARMPRQTSRTHEQDELQQFSTPFPISFIAARLLDPQPGDVILEPSAGTASLALWPRAVGASVICNEIAPRRRALLETLGFVCHSADAEILDDLLPPDIKPTGILMNPPFSATGGRVGRNDSKYGARHLDSALRRLEPGGRLVAVMSGALAFNNAKFVDWWEAIARQYNIRCNVQIDGREYAKQGTAVSVQLIVIDKSGPTPGADYAARLGSIPQGRFETLEDAWGTLEPIVARAPAVSGFDAEPEGEAPLFVPYLTPRLIGGEEHPAPVVEASAMAAVAPPPITYHPHLPPWILSEGLLSNIQMERVIYAGQRHEQRLPDGSRAGYFVGDGTGVGKGRILAGILADNWYQGRRRAVWFSVSRDLIAAARRDLHALGLNFPLAQINDYAPNQRISLREGVIFCTYPSLIAKARGGERRFDQITKWLGAEGLVIFDESHKAKNALASGFGEPTQTGQAVVDLQSAKDRPDLRVVYSSATGATDVRNLVYMSRIGFWGPGTAFHSFEHFMREIEDGGVGAMELLSRDLKALGIYGSGSISFGADPVTGLAVEYRECRQEITPEQREMYDHAAEAWQVVLQNIDQAIAVVGAGKRQRAAAANAFWSAHQRFFRQLIASMKVPAAIREAERAIADGMAPVISMIGTGEARTKDMVMRLIGEGGTLDDFDFTPRETVTSLVEKCFPTQVHRDSQAIGTNQIVQVPVFDDNDQPVLSREALRMKQQLLDKLSALRLPGNPLDLIVNHFGEDRVAELTGRHRRLVYDPNGKAQYKKRAPEGVAMDRVNLHEMREFQAGRKDVAIISNAASMGIDLHASNQCANQKRRVMITLETSWSADAQLQTFGRVHRSDQASPPIYSLLCSDAGGERRFLSTIAKRLQSLGALTKGERRAVDNNDLSRFNFETVEGRAALTLLFRRILAGTDIPGLDNPRQTLRNMGLLARKADGGEGVRAEDEGNVPRFLNRVLALKLDEQNAIFGAYADLFDQTVAHAKATGAFDEGVTDIRALAIRAKGEPNVIYSDAITGAQTLHYALEVDRPAKLFSFGEARALGEAQQGVFLRHNKRGVFILVTPSRRHTNPQTGETWQTYAVHKPEGERADYLTEQEIARKYQPVAAEDARDWWEERRAGLPAIITEEKHIIAGAIMPLWSRLRAARGATLRIVRVATEDGQRIVGALIPPDRLWSVLRVLGVNSKLQSPAEVYSAVLNDGAEVQLANSLRLKIGYLGYEPTIQVFGAAHYLYDTLRGLGLLSDRFNYQTRFFIVKDDTEGPEMLGRLLESFPLLEGGEDAEDEAAPGAAAVRESVRGGAVDLRQWIIPVETARWTPESQTTGGAAPRPERSVKSSAPQPLPAPRLNGSAAPDAAVDLVANELLSLLKAEQGTLFD